MEVALGGRALRCTFSLGQNGGWLGGGGKMVLSYIYSPHTPAYWFDQDEDRFLRLRDENIALKKECNEQKQIIKRCV